VVPIPFGKKAYRRADITMRDPVTGELYHYNVGRVTRSGKPVAPEREALDDIERATGIRPGFFAY
jgi:hypothetical protein